MRQIGITAAAVFAALILICPYVTADESPYDILNKEKVYYGDCSSFSKPATISINEVFSHIRSYILISERKLNENDPEYWVLLLRANEKFREVLKKVAQIQKLDLIAERGAIKAINEKAPLPDITNIVIGVLMRDQEEMSDE